MKEGNIQSDTIRVHTDETQSSQQDFHTAPAIGAEKSTPEFVKNPHKYPNRGYQGSFSHTSIFDHLSEVDDSRQNGITRATDQPRQLHAGGSVPDSNAHRGAKLVEQMGRDFSWPMCSKVVSSWLAREANLSIAGSFTRQCLQTAQEVLRRPADEPISCLEVSRCLFKNTARPIQVEGSTSAEAFSAQFCQGSVRWETLGIYFTSLARAATELSPSAPIFKSEQQRRHIQRLGMNYSDLCIETALSLDCLNDLQLILQYENFILHSVVDGDQSYHSWRRLGDVISSLLALGYHQEMDGKSAIPSYLLGLRRAIFARAYSADKNVSIFLGRPPRMHRKYCRFNVGDVITTFTADNEVSNRKYAIDTQWSAICAGLKEEVLDLFHMEDGAEKQRSANSIRKQAETKWLALPKHLRLEGPLKICHQTLVVRDFMVSARLNYLHVLFLLSMALARDKPTRSPDLVSASADILDVVVEALIQKDQLVNSGTSLVWKVAYYGLPSAGIICLWLLNQIREQTDHQVNMFRVLRNLNVLVAELESGLLVQADDANYELFVDASQAIENLLRRLFMGGKAVDNSRQLESESPSLDPDVANLGDWSAWDSNMLQDFESEFWLNLAGHPYFNEPE